MRTGNAVFELFERFVCYDVHLFTLEEKNWRVRSWKFFSCTVDRTMTALKPFTVNGVEYKTQRAYFLAMNPDRRDAEKTEIKMFCYHTLPEYKEYMQQKSKMRYRNKKGGNVRLHIKHEERGWNL